MRQLLLNLAFLGLGLQLLTPNLIVLLLKPKRPKDVINLLIWVKEFQGDHF